MQPPVTRSARSEDMCTAYQTTGEGPVEVIWTPGAMHIFSVCEGGSMASMFAAMYRS